MGYSLSRRERVRVRGNFRLRERGASADLDGSLPCPIMGWRPFQDLLENRAAQEA